MFALHDSLIRALISVLCNWMQSLASAAFSKQHRMQFKYKQYCIGFRRMFSVHGALTYSFSEPIFVARVPKCQRNYNNVSHYRHIHPTQLLVMNPY